MRDLRSSCSSEGPRRRATLDDPAPTVRLPRACLVGDVVVSGGAPIVSPNPQTQYVWLTVSYKEPRQATGGRLDSAGTAGSPGQPIPATRWGESGRVVRNAWFPRFRHHL